MTTHARVLLSRPGSFLAPQPITVTVRTGDDVGMDVSMSLDAFIAELAATAAHPAAFVTRAQLQRALATAAEAIVTTMKHEAARVM